MATPEKWDLHPESSEANLLQRIAALRGALGAIAVALRSGAYQAMVADIADGALLDDDRQAQR